LFGRAITSRFPPRGPCSPFFLVPFLFRLWMKCSLSRLSSPSAPIHGLKLTCGGRPNFRVDMEHPVSVSTLSNLVLFLPGRVFPPIAFSAPTATLLSASGGPIFLWTFFLPPQKPFRSNERRSWRLARISIPVVFGRWIFLPRPVSRRKGLGLWSWLASF